MTIVSSTRCYLDVFTGTLNTRSRESASQNESFGVGVCVCVALRAKEKGQASTWEALQAKSFCCVRRSCCIKSNTWQNTEFINISKQKPRTCFTTNRSGLSIKQESHLRLKSAMQNLFSHIASSFQSLCVLCTYGMYILCLRYLMKNKLLASEFCSLFCFEEKKSAVFTKVVF